MVKPADRKGIVNYLIEHGWLSERRACRLIGISRTGIRHLSQRSASDKKLKARLLELAELYPRYGYLMLHGLLKNEGMVINRKRTYRIYTQQGLQVRTKKRKKLTRPRMPMEVPIRVNERWSMDFIHDQLSDGRRFRVLNIMDEFSRECVGQLADVAISGERVSRYLGELINAREKPKAIVCDNGTEFTSKAMFFWAKDNQVALRFIQPGKPTQNAFIESFNDKFRGTCLNLHWFRSLSEAREEIEKWRIDYNQVRPHSSLNYQPPEVFARKIA